MSRLRQVLDDEPAQPDPDPRPLQIPQGVCEDQRRVLERVRQIQIAALSDRLAWQQHGK